MDQVCFPITLSMWDYKVQDPEYMFDSCTKDLSLQFLPNDTSAFFQDKEQLLLTN